MATIEEVFAETQATRREVQEMHVDQRRIFDRLDEIEKRTVETATRLDYHLEAHRPWTRAMIGAVIAAVVGVAGAVYAALTKGLHG